MANPVSGAIGASLAVGLAIGLGIVAGIGAAGVALIEVITIVAQKKLANHNGNNAEKHPKFVKGVALVGGFFSSGLAGIGATCFATVYTLSVALPILCGVITAAAVAYLHMKAVESYLSKPALV